MHLQHNKLILMALLILTSSALAQDHADRHFLADHETKFRSDNKADKPLLIISKDITIPGSATAEDYTTFLAFDAGDQLVIDLEMKNRKGTNNLEVYSYPDNRLIFSKRKFTHLKSLRIPLRKRAIYQIRLYSNHTFNRQVSCKISRIAGPGTRPDFDTHVSYREDFETVTVHKPQKFYLNSTSNKKWKGGKNRVMLPIVLPEGTERWYFEYAVSRDQKQIAQITQSMDLMGQLTKLIDQTGLLNLSIAQITRPPGVNIADVYLLDHENASFYLADEQYQYYTEGTRENFQDGLVEITRVITDGLHLGLQNKDAWHGVHIAIEVVAIVKTGRWVMDEEAL